MHYRSGGYAATQRSGRNQKEEKRLARSSFNGACTQSARAFFCCRKSCRKMGRAGEPPASIKKCIRLACGLLLQDLGPGAAWRPPGAAADGAHVKLQFGDGAAQGIAVHS